MSPWEADWGPIFVYGPMLLPAVWGELIGRVPDMAPAKILGFRRGGVSCSPEAALVQDAEGSEELAFQSTGGDVLGDWPGHPMLIWLHIIKTITI